MDKENISVSLKKRFCKDCDLPINLFQEPYFSERLELFDPFYRTLEKWNLFTEELIKYPCEQDYFEEYSKIKDMAINDIKKSGAYQKFNAEDMDKTYPILHMFPNKHIFKESNDNKIFVSVDMVKANFASLHFYDPEIFYNAKTWEEFIGRYTDNKHIINSKYIRQVILGNCNPKKHIRYEKYLISGIFLSSEIMISEYRLRDYVVYFSNDEIVFEVTNQIEDFDNFMHLLKHACEATGLPLRFQLFKLHKIQNTDGYIKVISQKNKENEIDFKCLDAYMLPFVIRKILGQEITEGDKTFFHEGLLAKFVEIPEIEVNLDGVYM